MAADGPLVIFDCDGVLVDSEPVSVRVLVDALARKGLVMEEEERYDSFREDICTDTQMHEK